VIKKKVLININSDWSFLLHRLDIAISLKDNGYEVYVATKDSGKKKEIEDYGFNFVETNVDRKSLSLFKEITTIFSFWKTYKEVNPDIVYQVTIKPIVYGSLVAKLLKIPTINTVCGLGYTFTKKNFLKKIVIFLYRLAHQKKSVYTFFENNDDLQLFKEFNILNPNNEYQIVNGVGVDLDLFDIRKSTKQINEKLVVLIPARLLWDKGVGEFIKVANLLKDDFFGKVYFKIIGMIDNGNPQAISRAFITKIKIDDYLVWEGLKNDMVEEYSKADIVVLPSYREGLPTALAEACAMSKPIVTTDAVGCKECVLEGVNGYKVPVKSINELRNAIEKLLLSEKDRISFGIASRKLAESKFDRKKIVKSYLKIFNNYLK